MATLFGVERIDGQSVLVMELAKGEDLARGRRKKAAAPAELSPASEAPEDAAIPDSQYCTALGRRWAELIRRVYEIDPLVCPRCGGEVRMVGFIT